MNLQGMFENMTLVMLLAYLTADCSVHFKNKLFTHNAYDVLC